MTARALVLLCLLAAPAAGQVPGTGLRPGDRVLLAVEGEKELSDTFTVVAGPALDLPGIGEVPLAGVPRGELERYLTEKIGRYFKRADIRARALVRLSIVGEVDRPGFYAVPADLVLTDALMITGGPTRDARMQKVRIERNGVPLWDGDRIQHGLASGYTVDQFGLQDGDRVVFPREPRGRALAIVGILVAAVPAVILAGVQLAN